MLISCYLLLLIKSVGLIKLSDVVKNEVVKKDVFDAKIKNNEDKIPDITNLATNIALTGVGNKRPNVSHLVKKNGLEQKN